MFGSIMESITNYIINRCVPLFIAYDRVLYWYYPTYREYDQPMGQPTRTMWRDGGILKDSRYGFPPLTSW